MAEFKVKHMMISNVKGQFSGLSGTLTAMKDDVTNPRLRPLSRGVRRHARPAARRAPEERGLFRGGEIPDPFFKSTTRNSQGPGELAVTGELTIHGVTHTVRFAVEGPNAPAKDPWGNTRIGRSATTKINRKDYGLTWNTALETGGILVGEEVTITLDLQFVKS